MTRKTPPASTDQFIKLVDVFGTLDAFVAEQKDAIHRELLAQQMLSLAAGFYSLMVSKRDLEHEIKLELARGSIDYDKLEATVQSLRRTVSCFRREFDAIAPEIAALQKLEGAAIEAGMNQGLDAKVSSIDEIISNLGIASGTVGS